MALTEIVHPPEGIADPVHELGEDNLRITLSALAQLLHDFTRESGVADREIIHDLYQRLAAKLLDDA